MFKHKHPTTDKKTTILHISQIKFLIMPHRFLFNEMNYPKNFGFVLERITRTLKDIHSEQRPMTATAEFSAEAIESKLSYKGSRERAANDQATTMQSGVMQHLQLKRRSLLPYWFLPKESK